MPKGFYKPLLILGLFASVIFCQHQASAYTANKVWLELRPNGRFRVNIDYTVPALKERRFAYVEFSHKEEAEKYYFDVIRGADFFLPEADSRRFKQNPLEPRPW